MIFDIDIHSGIAIKTDNGLEMSYKQLCLEVNKIVKLINQENLLIFCLCSNSPGSVVAYLSALSSKSPILLLDATKTDEIIEPLIELYNPNYIWVPEDRQFPKGCKIFNLLGYNLVKLSDTLHHLNPELALLLTTSGSTGSPKLVRLSLNNVISNAKSICEYLSINKTERPITSLPMHYSYGLSVINSHLAKGATILLTDKSILQREFWDFAKTQDATSISGVPYTYEMLKRLRFFRMNLPSLKTLTQAGGKLSPELAKEYAIQCSDSGKRFIIMYGQTEATARMSYIPESYVLLKYSSIGIPIPGGKFYIVDDSHNIIKSIDTDGELVYEGKNVFLGYAECIGDLVKGDENNGILFTGDIGRVDKDGFYYITGRKKRFVKIWGNRCNLDALELLLKSKYPQTVCTGVDDLITIYIAEEYDITELKKYLAGLTGFNVKAFSVKKITEIPTSSSGKILYKELENH